MSNPTPDRHRIMKTPTPRTDRYTGLGFDIKKLCETSRELERESQWRPVCDAPMGVPMWLRQEGRALWIGGKDMVDSESWLWGNCYDNYWHDGTGWKGDFECDDDYKPTLFMLLPQPPTDAI